MVCINLIWLIFACQWLAKIRSCEGEELNSELLLLFLGPDDGFCLIDTSTLNKDLFLSAFDEAQDKTIQIHSKSEF